MQTHEELPAVLGRPENILGLIAIIVHHPGKFMRVVPLYCRHRLPGMGVLGLHILTQRWGMTTPDVGSQTYKVTVVGSFTSFWDSE